MVLLVLSQHLVRLLFFRNCVVEQRRSHQHSSLPHKVVVVLNPFELLLLSGVFREPGEDLAKLVVRIIFVVQIVEEIYLVYEVSSIVGDDLMLVPISVVYHLHELNQTVVEDVKLVAGKQSQYRKSQRRSHLVKLL